MVIRAGGKNWIVEERDAGSTLTESWDNFMGLSFRPEGREAERVEIRWIPRAGLLTEGAARRLFELAGDRVWRDPRSGQMHQVHLVDEGADEEVDPSPDSMRIRFRCPEGEVSTRYRLRQPLGLASPEEMESMLDEARGGVPARA